MADGSASHRRDLPDDALVARVRQGDAAAFATLVARHYESCARYAARFLGHREDAEDAVQETWLRAHRALGAYRERELFEQWLFGILGNVCRTTAGRRSREAKRMPIDEDTVS